VQQLNEAAISNILVEVDFIEQSLRDGGQSHLSSNFDRLKLVSWVHCVLCFLTLPWTAGIDSAEQQCPRLHKRIGQASIVRINPTEGAGSPS